LRQIVEPKNISREESKGKKLAIEAEKVEKN